MLLGRSSEFGVRSSEFRTRRSGGPGCGGCLLLLSATLLLAGLLPRNAAADDQRLVGYSGPPLPITTASLIPRLLGDRFYGEQYNFEANLEGQRTFYLRLRLANFSLGRGKLEATLRLDHPTGGPQLKYRKIWEHDGWSSSKTAFDLSSPELRVSGTPDEITIRGQGEGFDYELTFRKQAAGWQPGSGKVLLGEDGYLLTQVVFPRAFVQGAVNVGGARHALSGHGWATHSGSNRAPHQVARRRVEFDSHDSDYTVFLRYFMPAEGYPQRPLTYLLITYRDQVVFQSYHVRLTPAQATPDPKTAAGYLMARQLLIEAEAPGQKLRGVLHGNELYLRTALLEEVNAIERLAIKAVAEPVDYNFRGTYQFTLENAGSPPVTFSGKSTYSLNYLNK